jgi:hypothetical protein
MLPLTEKLLYILNGHKWASLIIQFFIFNPLINKLIVNDGVYPVLLGLAQQRVVSTRR